MIVELTGTIVHETDKALLFEPVGYPETWFPLSQIEKITRAPTTNADKIEVESWILDKKGIEY